MLENMRRGIQHQHRPRTASCLRVVKPGHTPATTPIHKDLAGTQPKVLPSMKPEPYGMTAAPLSDRTPWPEPLFRMY
jgi:hypothetical protein